MWGFVSSLNVCASLAALPEMLYIVKEGYRTKSRWQTMRFFSVTLPL